MRNITPFLLFLFLFICSDIASSYGQAPQRWTPPAKWSLSFNPLGFLEPQAAAGIGVGYQWNDRWQLWLESSLLFHCILSTPQSLRSGFREILALKYYFGKRREFFGAVEGRFKKAVYTDQFNFYNPASGATLYNYSYTLKNAMPGGAFWIGGSQRWGRKSHFRIEESAGLGFKYRLMTKEGFPAGFRYYGKVEDSGFPFTTTPRGSGWTMYLPASIRVFYVL
jgi:hypothetical protein